MPSIAFYPTCPVEDHVRLTSDQSTTSASLADVAGMAFVLESESEYWIEVFGLFQTAATTTGFILGATAPTGTASMDLFLTAPSSVAGAPDCRFQNGTTSVSATTASNLAATTQLPFHALFHVTTGAESASPSTGFVGSFQLRWATEVGGSNATLEAGTVMMLRRFDLTAASAAVTLGDPGLATTYTSTDVTVGQTSSATVTLTYLANGTWTVGVESDDSLAGSPAAGNWGTPTTAGAGANYELKITVGATGGGVVSNDAPDWTSLAADRRVSLTITSTGGAEQATRSVTVEVRQRGTTTIGSSGSTTLSVSAEATSEA